MCFCILPAHFYHRRKRDIHHLPPTVTQEEAAGILDYASDFSSVSEFEAFKADCKIENSFNYFSMELMEYFADFSLYDNRDPQWREGRETQTLSTAELHAQDASLIELRTTVLPSLRQKLVHLCESMDVPDLGENPMPNMIQINQTNNHNLQGLKTCRSHFLLQEIRELLERLTNRLFTFCVTILSHWSSYQKDEFDSDSITELIDVKTQLTERTAKTAIDIDRIIEFARQSDFEFVQRVWRAHGNGLGSNLIGLTTRVDLANQLQPTEHTQSDHDRPQDNSLRQHIAQLARSTIPLVKLARLFFNKLSNTTITKLPFRRKGTMSSAEIGALRNSTSLLYLSISHLTQRLVWIYDHNNIGGQVESSRQFGNTPLLNTFDSSLVMLSFHLVPLTTDLACSGNLFKTWFSELRSQFNVAWVLVANAINVFEPVTQRL
ncbi:hypothetical protein Pst134EA_028004 [Puccinia striiformis f. sp. tritici]|uniref:hypothetical protein n=1 Tax=Puccinia striiformis f. sp. tritici TaxID=168172 RepID=UPI002008810A|nr:hypothetical protein Pst134EA_028004 [Puccinia striiformis f. sp. tritici]KAH9448710.1 hypothetical protein Pst134EA_028004 [Puccinia striiformis f. sp. tritici]